MGIEDWVLGEAEAEELDRLIDGVMGVDLEDKSLPEAFYETGDPIYAMVYLVFLYEHEGPEAMATSDVLEFISTEPRPYRETNLPRFIELMMRRGIGEHCEACAINLGTYYYLGNLYEQDYAKAASLYELAAIWGDYQAAVNLGYIYEYGRTGERDLQRAYAWYALASTMAESPSEALYKMGDCYSRGLLPEGPNINLAMQLWNKSFAAAIDDQDVAQPAIRLAPLFLDPPDDLDDKRYDPLLALKLYQMAEVGLRIAIDQGLGYYRKRLQQAIEGQQRARAELEMGDLSD